MYFPDYGKMARDQYDKGILEGNSEKESVTFDVGDKFHLRIHRRHIFQDGFTNIEEHGNADFQCHDKYFGRNPLLL